MSKKVMRSIAAIFLSVFMFGTAMTPAVYAITTDEPVTAEPNAEGTVGNGTAENDEGDALTDEEKEADADPKKSEKDESQKETPEVEKKASESEEGTGKDADALNAGKTSTEGTGINEVAAGQTPAVNNAVSNPTPAQEMPAANNGNTTEPSSGEEEPEKEPEEASQAEGNVNTLVLGNVLGAGNGNEGSDNNLNEQSNADDSLITEVNITLKLPDSGATVGPNSEKNSGVITIPSGAGYIIPTEIREGFHDYNWQDAQEKNLPDDHHFQADGRKYFLLVTLVDDGTKKFADKNAITVSVNGGTLVSVAAGTDDGKTTLTVKMSVTFGGSDTYSISAVNATADKTSANANESVVFTAKIPDEYKNDDYKITGWCVDGQWTSESSETKTVTMPAKDLEVMVRYEVTRDTSTDASKIIVDADLTIKDEARNVGVRAGSIYSESINSAIDKVKDSSQEAVQALFAERDAAFNQEITDVVGLDRKEIEDFNTTRETTLDDSRETTTKRLDKAGAETTGDDYVIVLSETSGSYGTEYTYYTRKTVSYWSTSRVNVTAGEGGKFTLVATKGSDEKKKANDVESAEVTVENDWRVTLTANPATDYKFTGWYKGADESADLLYSGSEYEFTTSDDTDRVIYARFEPIARDKKVEVVFEGEGAEHATATINGTEGTTADVAAGETVTVTITPDSGYAPEDPDFELDGGKIYPHEIDAKYSDSESSITVTYKQPEDGTKITVIVPVREVVTIYADANGGIKGERWQNILMIIPKSQVIPDIPWYFPAPESIDEVYDVLTAPEGKEYAGMEVTDAKGTRTYDPGERMEVYLGADATLKFLWEPLVKTYSVVQGDGSTWTKGSSSPLQFRIKSDKKDGDTYGLFTELKIDGKTVSETNYGTAQGSVVIDLKASYLETLSVGTHTLTGVFKDGEASAKFTVKEKSSGGSKKPSTPVDNVVTCQMAGYPGNYSWNEAAKACQPGYIDAGGNFHPYRTATRTVPNTADRDIMIHAWIAMLSITIGLFCAVKLLHEDWEV